VSIIPDKATIEYGRHVIQPVHDLLKEWERKAEAEGDDEKRRRMRFAAYMIQHRFLGSGEGCVITSFDERWLDDGFRQSMADAFGRESS
jgi:hypothetical protein